MAIAAAAPGSVDSTDTSINWVSLTGETLIMDCRVVVERLNPRREMTSDSTGSLTIILEYVLVRRSDKATELISMERVPGASFTNTVVVAR